MVTEAYANPYSAPMAPTGAVSSAPPGAERLRAAYLKHEASVRSFGLLYYLGAIVFAAIGVLYVVGGFVHVQGEPVAAVLGGLLLGAIAALNVWVGRGLRALRRSARNVATVFCVLGLIGFPLGTLINGYGLYLLRSKQGAMVFSPEYAAIREATPDMQYKTPTRTWVLLGVIVVLAVGVTAALAMS